MHLIVQYTRTDLMPRISHAVWYCPLAQVVELTEAGRQFFRDVFERYDLDDDNVLSPREYQELFATAPGE